MASQERFRPTRRQFLAASLTTPAVLVLAPARPAAAQERSPRPTPACGDDHVTPYQMEGPFFKPESPRRASLLEPGLTGKTIVVSGSVLWLDCRPVAGALVDFWQADDAGQYDNRGYRLRGHQLTDDAGRYRLETIVPGLYPGRTRHIHVKVQAPGQPVLTTQLYFPDEPQNARDFIFDPELLLQPGSRGDATAAFDFVLDDQLRANRARSRRR
jgi:protocatechuate 3,4-dioxygenase beta subunit